ncbi:MAG: hypothetical protein K1X57_05185 [Gemmataceae bacterium]|nr:hypothetical protein [Gemmataceae bacterium]
MRTFPTLICGISLGVLATAGFHFCSRPAQAANDRSENYIICTGMSGVNPRSPLDGVWLLDHKQGKLMATLVDRSAGKVTGFAEMDLLRVFGVSPSQGVNFVMTTGTITPGQSALYLVETTSGKFGVFTLGPTTDGSSGVTIMQHDMTNFRKGRG